MTSFSAGASHVRPHDLGHDHDHDHDHGNSHGSNSRIDIDTDTDSRFLGEDTMTEAGPSHGGRDANSSDRQPPSQPQPQTLPALVDATAAAPSQHASAEPDLSQDIETTTTAPATSGEARPFTPTPTTDPDRPQTDGVEASAPAPAAVSAPAPVSTPAPASATPRDDSVATEPSAPAPPQTPINKVDRNGDQSMVDITGPSDAAAAMESQYRNHLSQPLATMENSGGFFPSQEYFAMKGSMDSVMEDPAQLMMAMASMAGSHQPMHAMSPPSTVTPAQVTLPNLIESELDPVSNFMPANVLRQPGVNKPLESFARIEFPDSVFQMTTYAVVIGRDQRALEQARRDEKRAEEHRRQVEERASRGLPPPSPIVQDRSKFSKSYISEEGGMLGPESDSEDNVRPAKRRRTSTADSSQHDNEEYDGNIISDRQYVSHTPGAAAVDLASLRPSPWHMPFLGIHSSGPDMIAKTKAISREHLKIRYNQTEGIFEAVPMHPNGFFCEDVHCHSGRVVLKCGDRLQIKDIAFRFVINGVERGCTGAEEPQVEKALKKRYSQGGKEMSFDFEGSHGDVEMRDTSEDLSDIADSPGELSELGQDDDDEAEAAEDLVAEAGQGADDEDMAEQSLEPMPEPEPMLPQIPKKRGPGRPPKNGIMSKREQRLLKKQQQEMAKKALPLAPPAEPPVKRKVGRPRKHPLPENAGDRSEKRKYTPRKPKDENNPEGSDAERQAKEAKERKSRPKSPPLNLNKEDYSEQELQKPNRNYGLLIDEVLTAAGPEGLSLKQIYKRICEKYPYFYFFPETKGWESSVRHNLLGNKAFHKIAGGVWTRVPGIELDAGKKRKTSPPRRVPPAAGYGSYPYPYNAGQQMAPGAPGFPPGQAPAGYQAPAYNSQHAQAVQPAQQFANSASPIGQSVQPTSSHPPAQPQVPAYGAPQPAARAQFAAPQTGSYTSPYASRLPPTAAPPVKTEDGVMPVPAPAAQQFTAAPPRTTPNSGPSPSPQVVSAVRNGPSATPPANAQPARPAIEPRLLAAVVGLKNGLVDSLTKAGNPKAEAIVMSALNRCVGLKKEATENDKMEAICIKGIRQVIDGSIKDKGKSPTPGGSTQPPGPPPIFGDKVLENINGFKNVSITALKPKIGEARAELVALSAIDRVLGFTDKSLVPKPAEGQPVGNLEGVENHMINSVRQLLVGMNQKVSGST